MSLKVMECANQVFHHSVTPSYSEKKRIRDYEIMCGPKAEMRKQINKKWIKEKWLFLGSPQAQETRSEKVY